MLKGKDLRVLRLLHNIKTQAKAAELLGVSERTIAAYESDEHSILSDKLAQEVRARFNVIAYEQIKKDFFDLS